MNIRPYTEDWKEGYDYYAFIDKIEEQANRRLIVHFDCIKTDHFEHRLSNQKNTPKSFDEMEVSIIISDISERSFENLFQKSRQNLEGTWRYLRLTDNPNELPVVVYPDYYEEPLQPQIRYIEKLAPIDSNKNTQLNKTFSVEENGSDLGLAIQIRRYSQPIIPIASIDYKRSIDVIAYDVGQGNMNALSIEGKPILYYDVGGGCYWNALTYQNTKSICLEKKPLIILSHWDNDHFWTFNKLLRQNRIHEPTKWLVPLQKTGPSQKRFEQKLIDTGHKITYWPNHRVFIRTAFGYIVKCQGNSKNDSGLAIIFQGYRYNILLPGDSAYQYIPKVYDFRFKGIIAKHHGGRCHEGLNDYPESSSQMSHVIYSYGHDNNYGHPYGDTIFKHEQKGFRVMRMTPAGSVSFRSTNIYQAPCAGQCDLDIQQIF